MNCEVKLKERAGIINPIFTCQPAGAQYASIGIKDCIGIVHGGQGCVMFVRLLFSQHFKESFERASTSLHEDGAVFGALNRVEEAVDVLLMRYPHVKVILIISTCSTEVIGDDIDGVVRKLNENLLPTKYPGREVHLIPIHTPSFIGSMITGYDVAVRDIITYFAKKTTPSEKINLFTGWANPGDVRALKHLLAEMDAPANVLFEIEKFDAPLMPDGNHVAHGETTIADLQDTANATASFVLNRYEGGKAAQYLESEFSVPAVTPAVGALIYERITYMGNAYCGEEAANILLQNQMAGISFLASMGIAVRVNCLVFWGVNSRELTDICLMAKECGAQGVNLVPVRSFYGIGSEEIQMAEFFALRDECMKIIPQITHSHPCNARSVCFGRQCLLPEDLSEKSPFGEQKN